MKWLTLYTRHYEPALRGFIKEAAGKAWLSACHEARQNGLYAVRCAYTAGPALFADALLCLLEDIAIQENPIYRYAPKLVNFAQELRHTALHADGAAQLRQYLRENRVLHLEGYVTFRMAEYRDRLDLMTYSLIKKLGRRKPDCEQ